jgi:hypothetical protein
MSTTTLEDIRKARRELEKDLEAINRVESILARKNGVAPVVGRDLTGKGHLKIWVIEALKSAGAEGMRTSVLTKAMRERGYQFKSEEAASSTVSTILRRLVGAKRIEKKGKFYILKGEIEKVKP